MFGYAKILTRRYAPGLFYLVKTAVKGSPGISLPPKETFSAIYAEGGWGNTGGEPYSGPGSDDTVSAPFVEMLRRVIIDNNIKTVVDLGCGDYRVGRQLASMDIDYTGIDVVPDLVARNDKMFGSDRIRFLCRDITKDPLPSGDLCVVRQVLQHLSNAQIELVLSQLVPYRYAVVAEHHPAHMRYPNLDKDTGAGTRNYFDSGIYLEFPPFSVPNAVVIGSTPLLQEGERLTVYLIENR